MIFMGILVVIYQVQAYKEGWLHRYQQDTVIPSNTQNYSKLAANDIHDLHMVSKGDMVR